VVDQELRASPEKVRESGVACIGLEAVFLVHANPRQLLPLAGYLVTVSREFFLGLEQHEAGSKPFLT